MIFTYVLNIVRYKKWSVFFVIAVIIGGLRLSASIVKYRASVDPLLELHKCPACYGLSACKYIEHIDITPRDLSSAFSYIFGVKCVYIGTLHGRKIMLKKLAHSSELNEFDRILCEKTGSSQFCFKKVYNGSRRGFYELIAKEVSIDFKEDHFSRLRVCPVTRRLNVLFENVYRNNKNVARETVDVNIWTLTSINPEPLLLQILPAEEGWPVPKYFGACGRIIIEEYIGLPLAAYYDAPWLLRAKIASSLLNAAYKFTFENEDFGFYLTDISADNIAIDSQNIAKFIDLEHIIVVDKHIPPEARPTEWTQLQENVESAGYFDSLVYSAEDICNHQVSDHNYYAICQVLLALNASDTLLPGGLLHDIPKDILQYYSDIEYLLQQCTDPKPPHTRITMGMRLKKLLYSIHETLD